MNKEELKSIITDCFENTEGNEISELQGYSGEAFSIYDEPLIGFASAADPLFEKYKEPGIIGPNFMVPTEWLPEAKTVISIFFPFSKRVRESNAVMTEHASTEWAFARIEGQEFLNSTMAAIMSRLQAAGIKAVVPSSDGRFGLCGLVSNWSERHAAFAAGLGTFGMSRGLITRKGMAGRFGSIIISIEAVPDERPYTDVYEYCIRCGACRKRCPAAAFDEATGLKDHGKCAPFVSNSKEYLAPRYGCGLCQTGVPCQDGIPEG